MKKLVALSIFLIGFTNLFGQKYFSKMFDTYGEWESFMQIIEIKKDSLTLIGEKQNFFVSDSTRFKSLSIISLYKDSIFEKKYLFAKDTFQNGFIGYFTNLNNKTVITFEQDTRNNNSSYFLNNMDNGFENILSKKLLPISNKFYILNFKNINNKLYFFCADYTTFIASKLKLSMQCMDTNGNLLWGKVFQDKRCFTNNVVQTKDGNFLLAGLKYYGEGSGGDDSAFAWYAKVDTLGNILWEQVLNRGSDLMCEYVWATKANDDIYLTGTNYANYPSSWYKTVYGDSSFSYMLKINENNGKIEWQKRFLYSINQTRGLMSSMGGMTYYNGNLYSLIRHNVTNTSNQYVMFAKFDLEGNMIWKRLFQQADYSNRAYSLTPIDDGFLICGDSKDSTHAKGDSDAWLIKTDSNGCIIPGCNAKDGIAQIINPEKVFTVYPNPAQNEINVELNFDKLNYQYIESLAIYNMQGQLLKFRQAQLPPDLSGKEITKINTEDLANGNYLLIITTNKQQMAGKKFVVER